MIDAQDILGLRNRGEIKSVLKHITDFVSVQVLKNLELTNQWTKEKNSPDSQVRILYTCTTKNNILQDTAFTCRQLACSTLFEDLVAASIVGSCDSSQSCQQACSLYCNSCERSFCSKCASGAHQGTEANGVHNELRFRTIVNGDLVHCVNVEALEQILRHELTEEQPLQALYEDCDK